MTKEKFAEKVLARLGVWDRSAVDPVDYANVIDAYAGVYAFLQDQDLAAWALESEDVPDRFPSLITLVAAEMAGDYGALETTGIGWPVAKEMAIKAIRRQLAVKQTTDTVEAEYF